MPKYEVYATRWDNPRIIEELIPARGLEFSLPLSGHGEASFSATVEPGKSFWRPSISPVISGLLIARDGVPVWQGWVLSEDEGGNREFTFRCVEWGAFFERVPAVARSWGNGNDHQIFRDIVADAQAVPGQNILVQAGSTTGASFSDYTINAWDNKSAAAAFLEVADAQGGPEWYFGTAGTLDNPVRQLVLGDRLGHTTAQTVLEFVEDTEDYQAPEAPPSVVLLSDVLGPAGSVSVPSRRAGGNVIAKARRRDASKSATVALAIGAGEEKAQIRRTATANSLLAAGWPRMTTVASYTDVTNTTTLQRHANADLAASAGVLTGYSFVTLDGEPEWTQVPRGSALMGVLDTDLYGGVRPVETDTRLLNLTVNVPDDGGDAQVRWDTADVLSTD